MRASRANFGSSPSPDFRDIRKRFSEDNLNFAPFSRSTPVEFVNKKEKSTFEDRNALVDDKISRSGPLTVVYTSFKMLPVKRLTKVGGFGLQGRRGLGFRRFHIASFQGEQSSERWRFRFSLGRNVLHRSFEI
jgi:hypothetical protein